MTLESEDLVRIGQLLKAARKELGYSQKRVADDAGISRLRYHDIEAGRSAARTTTLINIGRALGFELMFIPQQWVPAISSLIRQDDIVDDPSSFVVGPEGDTTA
ncbi:helix-turn-helix domain-containing protein (plasmid) [Rhizobium sp. WL3]|uniref:helix-turn-helix transcriptional regulator n=1 Tax=Rhizobium sp. WL3 TaxID=2603277 RepID=UPI0011C1F864|nr:helix-turn-helix domain-containing protein [Rhizobium sp. WL3]QEE43284.1 helix-turn-helix domain-containing protein [Rhizobium sp. WL3]